MPIIRVVTVGLRCALLALAVLTLRAGLTGTPVANEAVRALGPQGDWRTASPPSLYDAGNYYTELGLAYIAAAAERDLSGDGPVPRFAEFEQARALLRQAVARSPADALGWAGLGLAAVVDREVARAEAALRRSWQLAPYNAGLAPMRLASLAFVEPDSVSPDLHDAIARDFRVARRRARDRLEEMRSRAPNLVTLEALVSAPMP